MKQFTFSRDSFYNLVWSKSILELSKEYRISVSDLRKLCKHYKIPTPINGHWQKIKHKKPTSVIALPEYHNQEEIILIKRGRGEEDIPFFKSAFNKRVYDLQNDQSVNLKVPSKMKKPHSLIIKTKNKLEGLDKISKTNYEIERNIFNDILPIHTNIKLRNRALRIMNTLVIFVYQKNHSIVFEYGCCHVEMFGQKTEINLRQKINRVRTIEDDGNRREDWVESNKLEFQAGPSYRQKCWIDNENKKLETFIPHIITWIEQDCKYWHDLRKAQAEEELVRENIRLNEEKKQHLLKLEKEKRDNLIYESEKWQEAQVLRSYIQAVIEKAKQNESFDKEKKEWLKWANEIADLIDPLIKDV